MEKANRHGSLNFEQITMLRNEKNLDTIRKIVSLQANMYLNSEAHAAKLIDQEAYSSNVKIAQETLMKILADTKTDLDCLAKAEREIYDALQEKRP